MWRVAFHFEIAEKLDFSSLFLYISMTMLWCFAGKAEDQLVFTFWPDDQFDNLVPKRLYLVTNECFSSRLG